MNKLLCFSILTMLASLSANDFPNGSFEYDLHEVWNRMPSSDVMPSGNKAFSYSSDRASGKRSLRLQGKKITFNFESSAKLRNSPTFFALKMKAPAGATVKVTALFHLNTDHTATLEKSFKVTDKWNLFQLPVTYPFGRSRRSGVITGPVEITIDPGSKELLVDDCFFAAAKKIPSRLQECVTPVPEKEMALTEYLPLPSKADFAKGECSAGEWSFKLFPGTSGKIRKAVPLSGVMLFPKSKVFFNSGNFALYDGSQKLAASFYPVAAWPGDKSLMALKVSFTADTAAKVKTLKLRFTPGAVTDAAPQDSPVALSIKRDSSNLWEKNGSLGKAVLTGVDYTGKKYAFKTLSSFFENGTLLRRGKMISPDGFSLGTVDLRYTPANGELDIALANTSKKFLFIKELCWQSEAPANTAAVKRTIWGDHAKRSFTEKWVTGKKEHVKSGYLPLEKLPSFTLSDKNGVSLHIFNAAQTFPNEMEFAPGMIKGALWPASAKVLSLAPGMTLRKKFLVSSKPFAASPDHAPVVMASAEDFARSGVMISMMAYNHAKFPFFESRLQKGMGKLNFPSLHDRFCYGQFNFGDHPGDGGWANLESFEDYVLFHRAMREENPELFRLALISSRHYGDIDTDLRNALPHIHSANHIIGGNGFGHAWIPGIMSAWLLTGDGAFYQTARRMLKACIDLPLTSGEFQQGRNFGFYLLTLAEGYAIFNDPAAVKRYMAQLKYQIDRYKAPPTPAEQRLQRTSIPRQNSLFYVTSSGLVPFHCWYGLTAFLKMYELTSDPLIRETAEKEFANIMNLEMTYRPQIETHWPGLPAEQLRPTIAADYLFGRGAFFYPVLAMYAKMTGKKEYIDLAVDTLYCGLLAARTAGNIQDVFMASPLSLLPENFDEAKQIAKVRKLLQQGSASKLLNGEFSETILYSDLVIPRKGIGSPRYPEWAVKKPYPRYWHFVEGKQIISSMFMTFRGFYYTLDHQEFGKKAPSLRLDMTDKIYFGGTDLTSAKFKMAPGEWRFGISMKKKSDVQLKRIGLRLMTFGKSPRNVSVAITHNNKVIPDDKSDPEIKICNISFKDMEKPGWQRLTFNFRLSERSLGTFYMHYAMLARVKNAVMYIDDVEITLAGK